MEDAEPADQLVSKLLEALVVEHEERRVAAERERRK